MISYSEFKTGFKQVPFNEMQKSWSELSAPGEGYINEDQFMQLMKPDGWQVPNLIRSNAREVRTLTRSVDITKINNK